MWGPWTRLRRWLRPLPTVGWVFAFERRYGQAQGLRFFGKQATWATGVVRDVLVPGPDVEAAFEAAKRAVIERLGSDAVVIAVREADRRDFPTDPPSLVIGPPRHFGFRRPGYPVGW